MGKVLITASHYQQLCGNAISLLEGHGHQLVLGETDMPYYSFGQLSGLVGDIDAAVVGMDNWTDEVFRLSPRLKAVAKFGVGCDNIDLEAATKRGIKVLNAPGGNANAVAELVVGQIICLLRGILPLHNGLSQGVWTRRLGSELVGKTVGLVGFGEIARRVAKKLQGFDVTVTACDLSPNLEAAAELGVRIASLEEVLGSSQIISLHIPATPESRHMINRDSIAAMADGACLINTARGALVDLEALCEALKSGKLAGAALDTYEWEPLDKNAEILRCPNVLCTPHTGAETVESYNHISLITARDIIQVLAGHEPKHWVNRPR